MNPYLAPTPIWLVIGLDLVIIFGILVAVLRKRRQRRTLGDALRRDQATKERKAKLAELQRRISSDAHRRVH